MFCLFGYIFDANVQKILHCIVKSPLLINKHVFSEIEKRVGKALKMRETSNKVIRFFFFFYVKKVEESSLYLVSA